MVGKRMLGVAALFCIFVLALSACGTTSPNASSTTGLGPSSSSSRALAGKACGVTEWGGPTTRLSNAALLHHCPTGPRSTFTLFVLTSSSGVPYTPLFYKDGGWIARLPPGTYRATQLLPQRNHEVEDCFEHTFRIVPSRTVTGVIEGAGCALS